MRDRVVLPGSAFRPTRLVEPVRSPLSNARLLLRASRPRQWTKNLLVVAAPGAAGILSRPSVLAHVAVAFVALTLCASATYLVNDVVDAQWDMHHPTKRLRPVASGDLRSPVALIAAAIIALVGLSLSLWLAGRSSRRLPPTSCSRWGTASS